jgi:hypothetical protein
MNPYEFILGITLIVMVAGMVIGVSKARFKYNSQRPSEDGQAQQMREEIRALKERIQVLERIATDKESLLEREIEQLRDR